MVAWHRFPAVYPCISKEVAPTGRVYVADGWVDNTIMNMNNIVDSIMVGAVASIKPVSHRDIGTPCRGGLCLEFQYRLIELNRDLRGV